MLNLSQRPSRPLSPTTVLQIRDSLFGNSLFRDSLFRIWGTRLTLVLAGLITASAGQADYSAPESVIRNYVKACYTGDAKLLESLFHKDALMTGHSKSGFFLGSPDAFFKNIRDKEPMSKTKAPYVGRITAVQISGPIASVTLEETGYFGRSYTDMFTLAQFDGEWKIVTKTYYQSE